MSSHSHEEFAELCALSISGSLNDEEWTRLSEHLLHCSSCRGIKRDYQSVVMHALPAVAAASIKQPEIKDSSDSWSLELAEASLMGKLDAEILQSGRVPSVFRKHSEPRYIRAYLLAALVLLCCGPLLYIVHTHRRSTYLWRNPTDVGAVRPVSNQTPANSPIPVQQDTQRYEKEIARLSAQLLLRSTEIRQLHTEKLELQRNLAARGGELNSHAQQTTALEQQLASAHSELSEVQDELSLAKGQGSHGAAQIAALQGQIANLNVALQQGDRELAEEDGLLAHDRDIRDLIGARNLYIAEIYDVAKNGATQKPFGRVFYTRDRSLIFYGYDLDQQLGVKDADTFQAWGRSGSNEHDVSLGLFYQDAASKKRWILKCNNARTLARLDAVFVTVEPKGGSAKPTGKPLLFTYLRLEPNHP